MVFGNPTVIILSCRWRSTADVFQGSPPYSRMSRLSALTNPLSPQDSRRIPGAVPSVLLAAFFLLIWLQTALSQPPQSTGEQAQSYLTAIRDAKLDPTRRQEAVGKLLTLDRAGAVELLVIELRPEGDSGVQRVIAQSIAAMPNEPPAELSWPLFTLMDRADDPTLHDLASAVGRYDDRRMMRRLIETVDDTTAPMGRRRGSVLSLGHHRTQATVKALIEFADPSKPQQIRAAAFTALAQLTGIDDFGSDLAQWQSWWEERKRMSEEQWYEDLLAQYSRRTKRESAGVRKMQERVVELQRQLYRATSVDARPDLLVTLLADPLEATRQLAIELTVQRLTDTQPITPELRKALLARLDDSGAAIRQGTARILRELADPAGADAVAERLAQGSERDPDVVRAYLLVLARSPRAGGVDVAVNLLGESGMSGEAAAALAKAIDAKLLSAQQRAEVIQRLRRFVNPDAPPEPRVIELLGKVAQEDDWPRIVRWLDDPDTAVRVAAATAWAQSDRPLRSLADHAGDAAIRPIVIEAATRRGDDLETAMALVHNKPDQDQAVQTWQRALVAMSSRIAPEAALSLNDALLEQKETPTLREQVLSAAIARFNSAATQPADTAPATQAAIPPALVDLILASGELRLAQGETSPALADLKKLEQVTTLSAAQSLRLRLGFFQAALASSEWNEAFTRAAQVVQSAPADSPARETVLQSLLAAAQRSLATGQKETALNLATQIRSLAGAALTETMNEKVTEIERRAQPTPPPAPTSQPATQPAEQPAAP